MIINIQFIVPILEWMQYDVINIGNHEFYKDKYYNVLTFGFLCNMKSAAASIMTVVDI
jgi:hypothetical protein